EYFPDMVQRFRLRCSQPPSGRREPRPVISARGHLTGFILKACRTSTVCQLGEPRFPLGPNVNSPTLVLAGLYRPFGVVSSILETLHGLGLVHLIRLGEFSDALLVSVRNLRKPLG